MTMKPNERTWPSYEEAKALVQARGIGSRKDYYTWVRERRVQFVPNSPDVVYTRSGDWQGWVDYLGTNNSFDRTDNTVYLPFYEAARKVHTLGINSIREWWNYVKVNELPEGIPKNPQYTYSDIWNKGVAWTEWLGKDLVTAMNVNESIDRVWVFVHNRQLPRNVMTIRKCTKSEALKGQADGKYQLLRMFTYEEEYEDQLWDTLNNMTTEYEMSKVDRLCPNYLAVLSQLASFLLVETS